MYLAACSRLYCHAGQQPAAWRTGVAAVTDTWAPGDTPGTGWPGAPAPGRGQRAGDGPGGTPGTRAGVTGWPGPAPGGPPAPPAVTLPKGGGAIRGIEEKLNVDLATGTASLTVPISTSPGRGGFGPSLALHYDSGAGNGPYGLGWAMTLPAITRKTSKGLPRYADDPDADTFLLTGADDLVPVREERDGRWQQAARRRWRGGRCYTVQRYQPRTQTTFARIERWRDLASGDTHWRTISPGNVTAVYGATAASRIADPADPARVYSWLICESYDPTGNAIVYGYQAEDSTGVDTALASERNRTPAARSANRYPKRIRYGNRLPWPAAGGGQGEGTADDVGDGAGPAGASRFGWMFEVVFDYGDHDAGTPAPEPSLPWPARPDPFSTHRPGFEVRTYRRCQRVLMFHHFPGEPGVGEGCLVSSASLGYTSVAGGGMTVLASATHTGYRRREGGGYRRASLPAAEFRYSEPVIGHRVHDLPPQTLANAPAGIDGGAYQWVDLDGEGLSGILTRQGGGWFYQANLGEGRFAPQRMLATQPAAAGTGRRQQLLDLAGDGHLDLVDWDPAAPGAYRRTGDRGWQAFQAFRSRPDIRFDDPQLRTLDLDGDGLADLLITGEDAFTWYPSLGYEGFGEARRAAQPLDEERGPRLVFADPEQSIHLADMTGDGLEDLVRIRNTEVCYWPNQGFGRFGRKVTMDHAPLLDEPGQFDQRRVRLADTDGSGTADLVYLGRDEVRLYFNRSGNGFAPAHPLRQGFPQTSSLSSVMVADLLGRGTGCLVWSSPLPGDAGRCVRYTDLMADGKPYLLTEVVNNLGARTRIRYAPSTRFYLADARAGRPWLTRLPFPVQVAERVEITDLINRNRFTTSYSYHHGYYDGTEREFRGFGMVEQRDAEELAVLEAAGEAAVPAGQDQASDLPPVLTRTWLHTGACPGGGRVSRMYAGEYHHSPGGGDPCLPDTPLPATLRLPGRPARPWTPSATEIREACRALKGMPLREEVYALDGGEAQHRPYLVTEHNYTVELLQPAVEQIPDGPWNYHAVLASYPRESATAHYERALYPTEGGSRADPRVSHELVLARDGYGNPLRTASAAYGRRHADPGLGREGQQAQRLSRLTCTDHSYTNAVDLPGAHRTPLPFQTRTFEIVGLAPRAARQGGDRPADGPYPLFGFGELGAGLAAAIHTRLPSSAWDAATAGAGAPASRLLAHTRVVYRRDDLSGPLPPGVLEPLALPYRSYALALTTDLLAALYGGRVSAKALARAGYARDGEGWWIPSARTGYAPQAGDSHAELAFARRHFFTPRRFTDPFGAVTTVSYDGYDLLVSQVADPLGNLVTAGERGPGDVALRDGNDYRVLAPYVVSDPNRNRVMAAFDCLGRVAGTAVMGKPEERLGDTLDGFNPDPSPAAVAAYFAGPLTTGAGLLAGATSRAIYDQAAYLRTRDSAQPSPGWTAMIARQAHLSELAPGEQAAIIHRFGYSDGFGREIQHKAQAAAGPLTPDGPVLPHRWAGSGWTVFNNKGLPVRSYEPFFTATHAFEFARAEGVSAVLFYDPPGRAVATIRPDGSYVKTVFDPWRQLTWDASDTVLADPRTDPDVGGYVGRYLATLPGWQTWYARRAGGQLGPAARHAAEQAAAHAGTPQAAWLDPAGRTFLTVEHNRLPRDGGVTDEFYRTHAVLDIEGNLREVRDPLDRAVMRYGYLPGGAQVSQEGMDTGGGTHLPDVTGAPCRLFDARGFEFAFGYDPLRRPLHATVTGPGIAGHARYEQTRYGEDAPDAQAANLRGRAVSQYDGSGVTHLLAYDFKGNLVRSQRQLAAAYREVIDWRQPPPLEERAYPASAAYDALNRQVSATSPDGSVTLSSYDPAGQLERVACRLRGAAHATDFAAHIGYDARGQRTLIRYGNGSHTRYTYDPETFRLTRLTTRHGKRRLQDLAYTYDPSGNPTAVHDHAQQRIFFRNQVVDPSASYRYDAVYRLIEASGREHPGQAREPGAARSHGHGDRWPRQAAPGDGSALVRYTQRYHYDAAGNLLRLAHRQAAGEGWATEYRYTEPSLLEPGKHSNRLTGTHAAGQPGRAGRFGYDAHGNITAMPGLARLGWDHQDRLHLSAREGGAREPTYYVYDGAGERARKLTEHAGTGGGHRRRSERIYLGGFEIFREYAADGSLAVERETLHVACGGHRVALAETRTFGSDAGAAELIRYQLADHLESAVIELDGHGRVITFEEYHPYGTTAYQAARSATQTPKRYRFTGKEHDAETGLYYFGARYYAPWLGRWLSCDPAGLADGTCPYSYVRDNPARYTDAGGASAAEVLETVVEEAPKVVPWLVGAAANDNAIALGVTGAAVAPAAAPAAGAGVLAGGGLILLGIIAVAVPAAQMYYTSKHPVPYTKPEDNKTPTPAPAGGFSAAAPPPPPPARKPPVVVPPPQVNPGDAEVIKGTRTASGAFVPAVPKDSGKRARTAAGGSGKPPRGPGQWVEIARSKVGTSLDTQSMFSGKKIRYAGGKAYIREYRLIDKKTGKPVYFDRFSGGVLGDVKDNYAFLVEHNLSGAADALLEEAERQTRVAKQYGLSVEWYVRADAAKAFRTLLHDKYPQIKVVSWSPAKPRGTNRRTPSQPRRR
jgi:RHS repeat-associated protein